MKFLVDFIEEKSASAKRDISVLLLVFGVAFFQFLGRFPLIEPDEGRYSEIPREMLERGDFITPLLNYVKYFEKPPLHYWLNAISFAIFGQNEFAARIAGTLCGLLTVLLTYHVGRKLFGRREGILAALILGTSIGFTIQARINFTDMTLTFCMSAALGFFILAAREGEVRKGLYYHLFYLFAALAVLAKGLIGIVLPGAVIFLYMLFCRRWSLLREMRLVSGILLFFAVCAPWFVLVSLKNPEFPQFFFIREHFQRFLTKVHHRYQPFWFFIPILLLTMLPWSFFIPAALKRVWQERKFREQDYQVYLLIWAVFIFLFFSKSNSKLIPYILPVFPSLAILLGKSFSVALDKGIRPLKIQAYLLSAVLSILGVGLFVYPHLSNNQDFSPAGGGILGALFLVMGLSSMYSTRRDSVSFLLCYLLLGSLLLEMVGPHIIYAGLAQSKSSKELALLVKEKAGKDAIVASLGYDQGLPFYSKRRVIVVGDMGELDFGSQQGDQSAWFISKEQFLRLWESPAPVYLLLRKKELDALTTLLRPAPQLLGQHGKKVLITNR